MLLKTTKLKKTKKKTQNHKNAESPLGGWGVGSKEPTQTYFLLLDYNVLAERPFGPCYLGSKGLQNSKEKKPR